MLAKQFPCICFFYYHALDRRHSKISLEPRVSLADFEDMAELFNWIPSGYHKNLRSFPNAQKLLNVRLYSSKKEIRARGFVFYRIKPRRRAP